MHRGLSMLQRIWSARGRHRILLGGKDFGPRIVFLLFFLGILKQIQFVPSLLGQKRGKLEPPSSMGEMNFGHILPLSLGWK